MRPCVSAQKDLAKLANVFWSEGDAVNFRLATSFASTPQSWSIGRHRRWSGRSGEAAWLLAADNVARVCANPPLTLPRRATSLRPLVALNGPDHPLTIARDSPILDIARPGIDHVRGGVDVLRVAGTERDCVGTIDVLSRGILVKAAPASAKRSRKSSRKDQAAEGPSDAHRAALTDWPGEPAARPGSCGHKGLGHHRRWSRSPNRTCALPTAPSRRNRHRCWEAGDRAATPDAARERPAGRG